MGAEIWVAIITGAASVAGVVITVIYGNKQHEKKSKEQTEVTLYRINQLEKKVELHNNAVERLYNIEQRLGIDEEKIKVVNHRIEDIEEEMK